MTPPTAYRHLSVAVPIIAESKALPSLLECLHHQTFQDFTLYCCVNNPHDADNSIRSDNEECLRILASDTQLSPIILDHCHPGMPHRKQGVGWARKELFSCIAENCSDDEIIVSMDADTTFSEHYLQAVVDTFNQQFALQALCTPYYHPLSHDEPTDRALLRYEIYMRYYFLRLLSIGSPYAFSALGSAMSFPLWAYRRVGGITPLQGGEDFYLMQKFCKTGLIELHLSEVVYPQGRPSHRVPFGTGPAIARGVMQMRSQYPLYAASSFRSVQDTYSMFPALYEHDIETPMSNFLRQQLGEDDLWGPLRKNFKSPLLFVHSCSERVDGLRILQYLRATHDPNHTHDEDELIALCHELGIVVPHGINFLRSPIAELNAVRDSLFAAEQQQRLAHSHTSQPTTNHHTKS